MTRLRFPVSVLAALVFVLGGCQTNITDADVKNIDLAEVRELVSSSTARPNSRELLLIYPRSSARYEQAHIPGARNLKLPQFPERGEIDAELAAYNTIVVYGDDPADVAARAMAKRLMAIGYGRVRLFAGGLSEWRAAGYRVDTIERASEAEGQPEGPSEGSGR